MSLSRHGIPDVLFLTMDHNFLVPNSTSFPKRTGLITVLAVHTTRSQMARPRKQSRQPKVYYRKPYLKKYFQLALLDFRNTPTNDVLGSPAKHVMGRRTKTLLPTTAKLLAPKTIQPSVVKANLFAQKETQKSYISINIQKSYNLR